MCLINIRYRNSITLLRSMVKLYSKNVEKLFDINNYSTEFIRLECRFMNETALIANEVMLLIENGYINGALSRVRTIVEYKFIIDFIELYGDKGAITYNFYEDVKKVKHIKTKKIHFHRNFYTNDGTDYQSLYLEYDEKYKKNKHVLLNNYSFFSESFILSQLQKPYIKQFEWAKKLLQDNKIEEVRNVTFNTILSYVEKHYNSEEVKTVNFRSQYDYFRKCSDSIHVGNCNLKLNYNSRYEYNDSKKYCILIFNDILFRLSNRIINMITDDESQMKMLLEFCDLADSIDNQISLGID